MGVILYEESVARIFDAWKCFPDTEACNFHFDTLTLSLNQGQGSVFTVRQYAQSIPCMEKPP